MFATSAPMSPAYMSAFTVSQRKKKPESCPARSFTSVTFGATPAIPSPLIGEAIVPDTCVPWPSSSTSFGSLQEWSGSWLHFPSINGMSVVQFRLSALLKFGAMSGWDPSIPVSITATITPLSPSCVP